MDKTLENLKETLEDEIKKIVKKGDITPSELESVQKAVCTIDMIDNMGMSEGTSYGRYSSRNRSYDHMPSYREFPDRSYGDYGERNYHDSYGNRMYNGDSYRRGRSPVTGRYISRGAYDDGYSGHSIMDRMVAKLESMYDEAQTDHERQTVSEWINRLRTSN